MDLLKGCVARSLFRRDERHRKAICAAPGSAAAAVHINVHRGRDLVVYHAAHALQDSAASMVRCVRAIEQAALLYPEDTFVWVCFASMSVRTLLATLQLTCAQPEHSFMAVTHCRESMT